ncbi:MT-A70 family [Moelleriella libera RCEF 2490]|uniref:MT-A70 family n=1 Tax=Moelleriella libera RCEF 2490 TaxID=1081109 RepID=A0A166UFR3_9HYPO|nr:MT-A70 family [Moelleriella libera RCEF 2490]
MSAPLGHDEDDAATSSILYQSADSEVVLLDIPRSMEESQVLPGEPIVRRILSGPPASAPFPTPEPKGRGGSRTAAHNWPHQSTAAQISDLMTAATVEHALQRLRDSYSGLFVYPRISPLVTPGAVDAREPLPVPNAVPLLGSIQDLRRRFMDIAPIFQLIVLDPPWPNRSARRRANTYATATRLAEMQTLLTSIPISAHLARDGLVAIWITNKASIPDFLTSVNGIFTAWGVELAAEWVWVKVTASGEPLYDVNSTWRKPWEKVLIAKRIGAPTPCHLGSKVIVAVPDIHSRKPNMRRLFEDVFRQRRYRGLEVFARNLTAGWWSWGDQVLHFQDLQYWDTRQRSEAHATKSSAISAYCQEAVGQEAVDENEETAS